MSRALINLGAFQAGWFSCVLGAANGYPLLGPYVVLIVVVLHLALATRPGPELLLIAVTGLSGLLFDSALLRTGWLTYSSGVLWAAIAPYWIVAMWLAFATTLNISLRWLRGRAGLALIFGAVGGPLSYLAGARLGGLEFIRPAAALPALAVGWAVVTPLLVWLAGKFDGIQPAADATPHHA